MLECGTVETLAWWHRNEFSARYTERDNLAATLSERMLREGVLGFQLVDRNRMWMQRA